MAEEPDKAEEDGTVIYLDEILAYQNCKFLAIKYGGTISARNMEIWRFHWYYGMDPDWTSMLIHLETNDNQILSKLWEKKFITEIL